ncbi:proline and serine-rich protein 3 [Plakobranchus ocellatus]|uniref:Proline and serine-rich protein 3 n=1 Tax=Plakobranchus ocellatus TaxID=259542 RepID=A0AAV4BDV4_9GAST|nr:proline and serine-rich protein 3 [Plakobranchus ocellatus]
MAHASHQRKSKDPFSVQPVPKSFYFPSPNKYVEGSNPKVIQAPPQAQNDALRGTAALNENNNFYSSSSTMLKTLPMFGSEPQLTVRKDETSAQYDEIWPDSERPSSPSANENTSAVTSAMDTTVSRDSYVDLQEAVRRLEFYDRHKSQTKDKEEAEDSTLGKYIERFRRAEPKSREERMREAKTRQREFWWLQSDSKPNKDHVSIHDEFKQQNTVTSTNNLKNEKSQFPKLTKEALNAMDEATLHLQAKAERLLSKSEMSVSSSGPIVSTDGLGTSCSASDQSTIVGAPSYRPAFINVREHYKEFGAQAFMKRGESETKTAAPSKPTCGDILAQWRFRRKVEESGGNPQHKADREPSNMKHQKSSDMDARLEEFRKRLLSHRMFVTPSDIQFERQRMDMLMEKDEKPMQDEVSSNVPRSSADPVLERLQRITRSQDQPNYPPSIAPIPQPVIQTHTNTDNGSGAQDNCDSNKNNSSNKEQSLKELPLSGFSDPMLNKNNTASSNFEHHNDENYRIDNLDVPIVGDAKSKIYALKDIEKSSNAAFNKQHDRKNDEVESLDKSRTQDNKSISGTEAGRVNGPLRDLPFNQMSGKHVPSQESLKKNKYVGENFVNRQNSMAHDQIYHQYLQAEKPNAVEATQHVPQTIKGHHENPIKIDEAVLSDTSLKSQGSSKEKNSSASKTHGNSVHADKPRRRNPGKASAKKTQQSEETADSTDSEIQSRQSKQYSRESSSYSKSSEGKKVSSSKRSTPEKGKERKANDDGGLDWNVNEERDSSEAVTSQKDKNPSAVCKREGAKINESHGMPVLSAASPQIRSHKAGKNTGVSQISGHPVKTAIDQAVRDHMFDGSLLLSSVDSWASAFPPSPIPAHQALPSEAQVKTSSPANKYRDDLPSLQSASLERAVDQDGGISDEDSHSDQEFEDDPLLKLLKQQRAMYIHKLGLIEHRLQELNSSNQSL